MEVLFSKKYICNVNHIQGNRIIFESEMYKYILLKVFEKSIITRENLKKIMIYEIHSEDELHMYNGHALHNFRLAYIVE